MKRNSRTFGDVLDQTGRVLAILLTIAAIACFLGADGDFGFVPGTPAQAAVPCAIDGKPCEQRRKCTECTVCTSQNDQCCCLHVDKCTCAILRNGAGVEKNCCK